MSRHQKHGSRETCEDCGTTSETTVTVDTWSGQAAWKCPACGKTQEPENVDAAGEVDR